jgi:hypothetical protein
MLFSKVQKFYLKVTENLNLFIYFFIYYSYATKSVYSTNLKVHLRTHHKPEYNKVVYAENMMEGVSKRAIQAAKKIQLHGVGQIRHQTRTKPINVFDVKSAGNRSKTDTKTLSIL